MSADDVTPKRYQVIAPMVVAESGTPSGVKLQNFLRHAVLPPDVPQKKLDLLLRRHMVVEIDEHGVPVPAVQADAAPAAPVKGGRAAKTG